MPVPDVVVVATRASSERSPTGKTSTVMPAECLLVDGDDPSGDGAGAEGVLEGHRVQLTRDYRARGHDDGAVQADGHVDGSLAAPG